MCGKMKSVLLLILLLIMIYYQHSPVIHAEDHRNILGAEEKGDEGNRTGEQRNEKHETEGNEEDWEEANQDERDRDGEDESSKADYKGSGTETKPISRYELELSEADGKNGYYVTAPVICITHVSQRGKTVYCLKNNGEISIEGKLGNTGDKLVLSGGQFAEGENNLTVYMEDETGTRLDDTAQTKRILLDTEMPEIIIGGPADHMTIKQTAEVTCRVFESNRLSTCRADIEWEDTDGRKQSIPDAEWSMRMGISETIFAFSENGTYYMEISAEDEAGNSNKKELQFTIIRQTPVFSDMGACLVEQEEPETSERLETVKEEPQLPGFGSEIMEEPISKTITALTQKRLKSVSYSRLAKTKFTGKEESKGMEGLSKEDGGYKKEAGEYRVPAVICAVCGAGGILYKRKRRMRSLREETGTV